MSDPFDLEDIPFDAAPVARPGAPPAAEPAYLTPLNEAQREAVLATEGPVLVLAGAGTGKTRVLVARLTHILNLKLAQPWEILSVTFTNKAAREMSGRVADLIGGAVEGLWLGTFHSIGVRILRRHAELIGLKSNFTIIDTDDQVRVLKQVLRGANIDEKRWPARILAANINRWKDRGIGPEQAAREDAGEFAGGRTADLYAVYQERLKIQNATDFGDLLMHCLTLFTRHPDVLSEYRRRFRYILVDEYQDTNVAQYLWLRLLAQDGHNICCVGDDDQSIYGWRGAEVANILRFEKDFPGAKVVRLERNYRSTPHILAVASKLIAHNEDRLGKTLWTDADPGEPVTVRGVWDGEEEARVIAEEIEHLHHRSHRLDEIAILVRAGYQTREFEDRFLTVGLPYRVIGGLRFYERREIRDALAYLKVIAQPDDGIAFERIINVPKRGLGEVTLQAMHKLARTSGISLVRAGQELIATDELRAQARRSLADLLESFARWRARADDLSLPELVETVLDESGYTEMWQRDKAIEAPGRLENLRELVNSVDEYESLASFLEHIGLVMDNDNAPDGDMINVMTLHAAKGLEFDTVFLPGWEENLFPNQRSLDEGGTTALEEERRLAHVGITRARKAVHISFAANRRTFADWQNNLPSRFIDELPAEHVEVRSDAGPYAASGFSDSKAADFEPRPWDSPGRRRLREHRAITRDGQVIEARAESVDWDTETSAGFSVGDRVFHQKFGYGRIAALDGRRLEITFDKAGTKKVIDSFVLPA
ncbi:MAG: UvrD-helicase domain-containing protein [Proteobacteria bacterium]|nr:UvrD-helicase domain-containing protein [Pseudomonadota bacterium]